MNRQQYEPQPERQTHPAQPAVLDELDRRKQELATVRENEQRLDEELRAERDAVAADEADLQQRIDQLLSSSPEEFVITFLQTEGE